MHDSKEVFVSREGTANICVAMRGPRLDYLFMLRIQTLIKKKYFTDSLERNSNNIVCIKDEE